MTKINKLVLKGFKSFANKTEIVFDDGFNCILGPNGSGKSNILDAICFVLGRSSSKSLRAEKTANLIYNGGKKQKPSKKGEVHIYFDNSGDIFPFEDDEIKVSRIVSKSGQSKYKINDKTKTRTEIIDLLSVANIDPDGYNIILQGDITKLIEMSPNERRGIVEEISGISVYEDKKNKALNELDKVENKLNDAEIVLSERKTYLKELKKDRDQALKFKELKEKVDSNKATYLDIQIKKKEKSKEELDSKIGSFQEKIKGSEEEVVKLKEEIAKRKENIKELNKEIELKGEKEQVELHQDIEDLKVDLAKNKTRVNSLREELKKIKSRKEQLKDDYRETEERIEEGQSKIGELKSDLENKKKERGKVEEKVKSFREKNSLDDVSSIEKELVDIEENIEKKQEEVHKMREEQQGLLREKDKLEYQSKTLEEKINKVREVEKENKDQLEELKKKKELFKKTTSELNECLDNDSNFASQLANARKDLHEYEEKLAKLKARNMSMQEKLSGNRAMKKILEKKKDDKRIHGTVAELGNVKDEYSLCLEVAAGSRINSVVVESDKAAADLIKYLKTNKLGVVSFIPLNKIKGISPKEEVKRLIKEEGVHGLAVDLIDFEAKFKKVFSYVFGTTLVVDDIKVARKIGIGKVRMVTLEGDLCDTSGVMRGGFIKRKKGSFKNKEVLKRLDEMKSKLSERKSLIERLEKKREENEGNIVSLRERKHKLEDEIIPMEKKLHLEDSDLDSTKDRKEDLDKEISEIDKKLDEVQNKVSEANKQLAQLKMDKQKLREKIMSLRDPKKLAELSAFDETKQKINEELNELKSQISSKETQIKDIHKPELEKVEEIMKQHDKERESFKEEVKELEEQIEKKEEDLEEKEKLSKDFYSKYKELFSKRDKKNDEIQAIEDKIDRLREKSRKAEIEMNKFSLKNAEVKAKLAALRKEFEEYHDAPLLKSKSEDDLKKEINKFERMLDNLDAVNMKALEIYEQVQKEYDKLLEKKEKLKEEKVDVLEMMNEIETKKKEQFLKTFKVINGNFQKFFTNLNKKGRAFLELENEESPFEGGLGIKVKITGKRYLDIKSLSGGEKTLTALAFIFAIQEHKPHSFYILDEIDAALDKHNSEKLAQLVRDYVDRAQYIIISHNDNVIAEADSLYGISMNEHNISKVTSLRV